MAETNSRYFEFGEFQLDAHRRVLRRAGETVHLTPRAFDLLCVMVENAGRTLEHDELLDKVWPDAFVEQGNLKKAISTLRRALGESPESNEFIVTVPRRGYRFSPEVKTLPPDAILIRETRGEVVIEEEIDTPDPIPVAAAELAGASAKKGWLRPSLIAGLLLIVAIGGWAAWPYLTTKPQRFSASDISIKRLMSEGEVHSGAISADGNYMVYAANHGDERSLWVRQVAMDSGVQIVSPVNGHFWETTFSPDASFIYYTFFSDKDPSRIGVYRVPTLGGTPQRLLQEILLGLEFSPDGSRFAAYRVLKENGSEQHELVTYSADGGDMRHVTTLPVNSLYFGIAWSPDGGSLLCGVRTRAPGEKPSYQVTQVSIEGGAEKVVMPAQEKPLYIDDWLPDGKSFFVRQRDLNSESFQIWQFFPATGEMARVTNDEYNYTGLTTSRVAGAVSAFRVFTMTSIWDMGEGNNPVRDIASGTNSPFRTDWTSDGRVISSVNENSREYLAIMDADGSKRQLLTEGNDGILLYPQLAGDKKHITFTSNRSGTRQLWQIDPETKEVKLATAAKEVSYGTLLSDGVTAIYTKYITERSTWAVFKAVGGSDPVVLSEKDPRDWEVSPDEKQIAIFTVDLKSGKKEIAILDLASGSQVKSFTIGEISCLRWTRAGDALNYIRNRTGGGQEIVRLPVNGEPESIVTSLTGERIIYFSWSRDGKRLIVTRSRPTNEAVLISAGSL